VWFNREKGVHHWTSIDDSGVLSWVHFGDLHITEAHEQNHHDFLALIEHANSHLAGDINFAVLPGPGVAKSDFLAK